MVPSTGQCVHLDPELDDMHVGTPVTLEEVGAAKARVDELYGFPGLDGKPEDPEHTLRIERLNHVEELAADSTQGGLVRVSPEVVQRLRLGDRELRRRRQRRK